MSRQNKVNPGMYTQRGRLTQDDAARELKRQRSIGSEHTWQPSKKDHFPRLTSNRRHEALGAETSEDNESSGVTPSAMNAKPARVDSAPPKTKKSNTAKSMAAKKTAGKPKAAKTAKRRSTKTVRKAVLARNVGGGGAKPRTTAKRRKS